MRSPEVLCKLNCFLLRCEITSLLAKAYTRTHTQLNHTYILTIRIHGLLRFYKLKILKISITKWNGDIPRWLLVSLQVLLQSAALHHPPRQVYLHAQFPRLCLSSSQRRCRSLTSQIIQPTSIPSPHSKYVSPTIDRATVKGAISHTLKSWLDKRRNATLACNIIHIMPLLLVFICV